MKNLIVLRLSICIAISWLVSSCDVVPLDQIEEKLTQRVSDKKVLVEYYTGHKCGNCPSNGGKTIAELKKVFGDKIEVITIHAGFFANVSKAGQPFDYDFKTTAGDQLDTEYGVTVTGTPKGMIDRTGFNNTKILTPTNWAAAINKRLADSSLVKIEFSDILNANNQISGKIAVRLNASSNEAMELKLYITEDSVINWQRDYSLEPEDIKDYIHHDVLRKDLQPVPNQSIFENPTNKGTSIERTFTFAPSIDWRIEQCKIIAVVRAKGDGSVVQCESIKLF